VLALLLALRPHNLVLAILIPLAAIPAILAPQLRQALLRLSRNAQAKEFAQRALRALAGFAKALKVKYQDIEVGLDFEPEPGLADNGDLEHDLQALLEVTADAAKNAGTALAMFVDELQYVEEEELAALITALHRTAQRSLPVVLIGAGLPNCPDEWAAPNRTPNDCSIFLKLAHSHRRRRESPLPSRQTIRACK
jgi:hypothetical protein